jgi:hypothetical protein
VLAAHDAVQAAATPLLLLPHAFPVAAAAAAARPSLMHRVAQRGRRRRARGRGAGAPGVGALARALLRGAVRRLGHEDDGVWARGALPDHARQVVRAAVHVLADPLDLPAVRGVVVRPHAAAQRARRRAPRQRRRGGGAAGQLLFCRRCWRGAGRLGGRGWRAVCGGCGRRVGHRRGCRRGCLDGLRGTHARRRCHHAAGTGPRTELWVAALRRCAAPQHAPQVPVCGAQHACSECAASVAGAAGCFSRSLSSSTQKSMLQLFVMQKNKGEAVKSNPPVCLLTIPAPWRD